MPVAVASLRDVSTGGSSSEIAEDMEHCIQNWTRGKSRVASMMSVCMPGSLFRC